MNNLFSILLNMSIAMAMFYLIYLVFLKKETFFQLNRVYLLIVLLFSLGLPLLPLHYKVDFQSENKMNVISALDEGFQTFTEKEPDITASVNFYDYLFIVYLTGAALFLLRLIIQTSVVLNLIRICKISKMDGLRIVENEKYGLPFSFFNLIFINPKFHKQADLNGILAHERVHVDQNHWVDLLVIELLTVVFWFNPFIWLFERSIKQNHEYLADHGVLTRGLDLSRYQALLINQLMGMQIIGVTNNLNFALSTTRLKMMTKIQSKKIRAIKLLFALPVLFLLMAAFAKPDYQLVQAEANSEELYFSPSEKETMLVKGVVKAEDGSPMFGVSIVVKGSTIGSMSDKNGEFRLDVPKSDQSVLVFSFVGYITVELKIPFSSTEISNEVTMKRGQVLIDTKDVDTILGSTPPPPPPPPPAEITGADGEEVFFVVEEMPSYPGGHYFLMKHYQEMKAKLKESSFFNGNKTEGKALVGFTVNEKGNVVNIKVIEKDNDVVAKAAVSMVQEMENWRPGKQRGKPVPVDFAMPFDFN